MFYVTQYSGLNEQSADPSSIYPIPMPSLLVILVLPGGLKHLCKIEGKF